MTVEQLKTIVETGPQVTNSYVDDSFQNYAGGVFKPACGTYTDANHAMTLVGYGSDDEGVYWLIRNSWGPDWGEEGYIRVRDVAENEGCFIRKNVYQIE